MALAHRLSKCYSGAVYDVLRAMGHRDCVLPHQIRPLDLERPLAGEIFTVEGHRDESLDEHQTLLGWTALLSKTPPGGVLVCQPNDDTLSHMGELSAETLQLRGVRGYIVDGGCRDSQFIHHIGFPVFSKYFTPRDIVGRWIADRFGEPIVIGGVTVHTGDYVLADRDGIVIIPAALAAAVTDEAETVMRTESLVRKAIIEGVDPQEAYLKFGKF
jgi:4-hydroxy-4-methyl-2-oxoglutarate aldolase